MDIRIRNIAEDEFQEWSRTEARGFSFHATEDYIRRSRSVAELDRSFGAFEGGQTVGATTTRTSGITIPGGMAGLGFIDDVSVLPTHRRLGILTRMMRAQLDQIHERGEPFAALTASESTIYERFGFGIASWSNEWSIDRHHTAMKLPPSAGGRVSYIDAETAQSEWPKLHKRIGRTRIGMVHYNSAYWRLALWDSEEQRRGASEFFHVAHVREGQIDGLCSYRIREDEVLVAFLLGVGAEVEAELWRYCFGIDLMTTIKAFVRPVDDPLPWRLVDRRRLRQSSGDHMWLRLIDVKAALEARRYESVGVITLKVSDNFCPWNDGVYTLEAGRDGAVYVSTDRTPDLYLSASDLAAVYLGGTSISTLVRAGRVNTEGKAALDLADRMFRTQRAPWFVEL